MIAAALVLTALSGCGTLFDENKEIQEEPKEDAVIATRIKAKLIEAGNIDAAAIKVESNQGNVRLSGFVDSEQQRQQATTVAKSVSGVKDVSNNLEVKQH
jgi:osmotically-inducible protein OsmY